MVVNEKILLHRSFINYFKKLNDRELPSSLINTLEYLKALRDLVKDYFIENTQALEKAVITTLNLVIRSRPTAFMIINVMARILSEIYKQKEISRDKILEIINNYISLLSNVPVRIHKHFMKAIENSSVLLVYSFSTTLLELFRRANRKDIRIIYIYDDFTEYDYDFVMELKRYGINISLAPLNAIMATCSTADTILMGSEAVFYDGSILNRTGSSIIALVARRLKKKTYVISAELKVTPISSSAEIMTSSLTPPSLSSRYPELTFLHIPIHEIVPADGIDYIILESGLLKPKDIKVYLDDLYKHNKEDILRYGNLLWKALNYNIYARRN